MHIQKQVYADLLYESIKKHENRPCLHIKRNGVYRTWRYRDFHDDCCKLVSALQKQGFTDGFNGVVIGENTPEWIIAYHAIFIAGGCTVPIDPNLPADEIRDIFSATQACVVFCSSTFAPLIEKFREEFSFIRLVVLLEEEPQNTPPAYQEFIAQGDGTFRAFERVFSPDDPIAVLFTSGTTGKPKGVVLMQKNYITAGVYGVPRMHLTEKDCVCAILPLYHVFGFAACVAGPLLGGLSVVCVPQIKGPLIMEALKDKKVSMLPAVPKMLMMFHDTIVKNVRAKGLLVYLMFTLLRFVSWSAGSILGNSFRVKLFSSVHAGFGGHLRTIISGGASLPKKYFNSFRLMGFNIVEGYGLTETFGPITLCPLHDQRQGSVGPVLPENEMKLDTPDTDGNGEVLLRGICVFKGYYNDPEATKAVFTNDGWFLSGDLGKIDKKGFLYLAGRSKDIIVMESGKNVYPDELEAYYGESESIEEIGVFGLLLNNKEIIAAVVVPSMKIRKKYPVAQAHDIILRELNRLGKNRPSYKKISDAVVTYQPLPRTSTRKIKKHELRSIFRTLKKSPRSATQLKPKLSAAEEHTMHTEEFKQIAALLKKNSNKKDISITPQTSLAYELDIDSLKFLDIIYALEEHFSVTIPEDTIVKAETVGDLFTIITDIKNEKSPGAKEHTTIRQRITDTDTVALPPLHTASAAYTLTCMAFDFWLKKAWHFSVHDQSRIPTDSPVLFAANHQSYLDIVILIRSLPKTIARRTYVLGKRELTNNRLLTPLIRWGNMIAVEREGDIVEALKAAIAALKQGSNVIIFPEGTRSETGTLQQFKSGIGLLMQETSVPVVPVKIQGSFAIWPKGKRPKLFISPSAGLSVTFGTPLTIDKIKEQSNFSAPPDEHQITQYLQRFIETM